MIFDLPRGNEITRRLIFFYKCITFNNKGWTHTCAGTGKNGRGRKKFARLSKKKF
jgi:hypothetical protein